MKVIRAASVTDAGRKRRRNEDSFVCEPPLFAIADGMGGAQAGELASRLAAAAASEAAANAAGDAEERIRALVTEANRRVHLRSSEDRSASGMGTTMTAALVGDGTVTIGHVGDSRAYRIRGDRVEQLTEDHSLVAELVRSGRLSPEEAESHPQRSVITRVLGTEADVDVDVFTVDAEPGDLFLLCSDGLTSMVGDDEILGIVAEQRGDVDAAARALVKKANKKGGEDNITVILFEVAAGDGDTAVIAAPSRDGHSTDEEDTLSPLEGLPPVAVEEAPPGWDTEWFDEAEPEPQRRPSRSRRLLLAGITALALLAIAAAVGLWALSRSHFVGAEPDGRVAIYQGFPYDIVGGLRLYRRIELSHVYAGELSPAERRRLFDHRLVSEAEARAEIAKIEKDLFP